MLATCSGNSFWYDLWSFVGFFVLLSFKSNYRYFKLITSFIYYGGEY